MSQFILIITYLSELVRRLVVFLGIGIKFVIGEIIIIHSASENS